MAGERYVPATLSGDATPEELRRYIAEELQKVANLVPFALELQELHVAPKRLRTGMVVLADGTDWDPGSGQGFYGYYGGSWVKLG